MGYKATLVLCSAVLNRIAHEVFGGVDGKSANGNKDGKQRKRQPLMFGFLFEEPAPTISHDWVEGRKQHEHFAC